MGAGRVSWSSSPKLEDPGYYLSTFQSAGGFEKNSGVLLPQSELLQFQIKKLYTIRCLRQLAIENKMNYPEASESIRSDFYMKDLVSGSQDIQKAAILCKENNQILESAGSNFKEIRILSREGEFLLKENLQGLSPVLDKEEILRMSGRIQGSQLGFKWTKNPASIPDSALVLLKENNLPSSSWYLGRIIQRHPGPDGVTRVATVRTSTGVVQRAVSKVCPLAVLMDSKSENNVLQLKANTELNEVPERIKEDLRYIREWLAKQPHLKTRRGKFHNTFLQGQLCFLFSSKVKL
ncbi:hypothetical protein ILUMI_26079 [Ignelater luminosus]|uniref:DUF5641 domain-containing protein n=1 Tax=Ignelater luminosus TaxID=2038154 RepID=A0A8K0C4N9_IGNLU|nr:hypothetical protein ILUMI_26079 [Ignelater luminosus]